MFPVRYVKQITRGKDQLSRRIKKKSMTSVLKSKIDFQSLILTLHNFWADQGCVLMQPYDMEVGAGTFHPATTLRS